MRAAVRPGMPLSTHSVEDVPMEDAPEFVYGAELELDDARDLIATATGLAFVPHESDFWGGDYHRAERAEGVIVVHKNADLYDGEPIVDTAPSHWTIVRVTGSNIRIPAPFKALPVPA